MSEEIKKLRRKYYKEKQREAILTEYFPDSILDEHLNVFEDGRERGLWFGMQNDQDIDNNAECSMYPNAAMLLDWKQLAKLHKLLGAHLKKASK